MKEIRYIFIEFEGNLAGYEIEAFRGAVCQQVPQEMDVFHNHDKEGRSIYRYPLVQYKTIGYRPAIVSLNSGIDELYKFFTRPDWKIFINGNELPLIVHRMHLDTILCKITDRPINYSIRRWQALNGDNYHRFNKTESFAEKLQILESILTGNILSFAGGIGWHIDQPVIVKITDAPKIMQSSFKGIRVATFDLSFTCNVDLPCHIGLGKGAAKGFGVISKKRKTL